LTTNVQFNGFLLPSCIRRYLDEKHSFTLQSNLNLVDIQDSELEYSDLKFLWCKQGNCVSEKKENYFGKISSPVNYHSEKSFSAKHLKTLY